MVNQDKGKAFHTRNLKKGLILNPSSKVNKQFKTLVTSSKTELCKIGLQRLEINYCETGKKGEQ